MWQQKLATLLACATVARAKENFWGSLRSSPTCVPVGCTTYNMTIARTSSTDANTTLKMVVGISLKEMRTEISYPRKSSNLMSWNGISTTVVLRERATVCEYRKVMLVDRIFGSLCKLNHAEEKWLSYQVLHNSNYCDTYSLWTTARK